MRRRRTDPGAVQADQPDAVLFGVEPGLGGNLAAGAGCAVQPEERAALRVTELGEADLAVLADRDVALEFRAGDVKSHAQSFTCDRGFTKNSRLCCG